MIAKGPNCELAELICLAKEGDKAAVANLFKLSTSSLHWGEHDGTQYLRKLGYHHWQDYIKDDSRLIFCEFVQSFNGQPEQFFRLLKFRVQDQLRTKSLSLVRTLWREHKAFQRESQSCERLRSKEIKLDVRSAVAKLPEAQREVINLELEGYPIEAIARTLEVSKQAIYKRRENAFSRLRPLLEHLIPGHEEGTTQLEQTGHSSGTEN